MTPCPFCKGRGRQTERISPVALGLAGEDYEREFPCEPCGATGDYETARLMRAVRLGEVNGFERLRRLVSDVNGANMTLDLEWDRVKVAVTDDLRRLRLEQMLTTGEITSRIDDPSIAAMGRLADDLRERVALECPIDVAA